MKNANILLPARMSIVPSAFSNLQIAVLDMPYQNAIEDFLMEIKALTRRDKIYIPYRRLNNVIMACAPTIVHSFERYASYSNKRRMLAVGRPVEDDKGNIAGTTLQYPDEEKIAEVIRIWAQNWGKEEWLMKVIKKDGQRIWQNLEDGLQQKPQTKWRFISPEALVRNSNDADGYAENGLVFDAIPSLLATLLHGKTSVVGKGEREVRWRKAQSSTPKRLCVVSEPLPINYLKANRFKGYAQEERSGFFSYKIDFQLHTQAGRKEPWVHVLLSCQRYGEAPLISNRKGNAITVLVGMNEARLNGWEVDTTLVRLRAKPYPKSSVWKDELSDLLADVGARSLTLAADILKNPQHYWKRKEEMQPEEYYILHTEGYRYSRNRVHSIMTGFGLAERSDIIEQTCRGILQPFLIPDKHFAPDLRVLGKTKPQVLWTFADLIKRLDLMPKARAFKMGISDEERYELREIETKKQRQDQQHIPVGAVERALAGKPLVVAVVYHNEQTRKTLHEQLRDAFLLNPPDQLPKQMEIIDVPIQDIGLLQPLHAGLTAPESKSKKEFNDQIRRSHVEKVKAWRELLCQIRPEKDKYYAALIELKEPAETGADQQKEYGIKGAVREACARQGLFSQMINPIKVIYNKQTGQSTISEAEIGRAKNAVQEIVTRQIGALYDSPVTLYENLGFSKEIAEQLDVVTFCLLKTNGGVNYVLAVRLRANGNVEVLFPEQDASWRPYAEAGPSLGRTFAEARKSFGYQKAASAVKLSPSCLASFIEKTIKSQLDRPSIVIIEAENWRNKDCWPQLINPKLPRALRTISFGKNGSCYSRNDNSLHNLLGIIRLRTSTETPQYITNRENWSSEDSGLTKDLYELSGFIDQTTKEVFHYFSVGRLPDTISGSQTKKTKQDPYKIDEGGGIPFKHQQLVEMVPFFVRKDLDTEEGYKILCRVPHFLRFSPAWSMGNIVLPYPMHLGNALIEDQLCILDNRD